ncbi:MAG: hypothetical protein OXH16_22705 [Gemmatimonadetes bacterium]|nr:hypothetical protein [Gemmatimonadota bacterium]
MYCAELSGGGAWDGVDEDGGGAVAGGWVFPVAVGWVSAVLRAVRVGAISAGLHRLRVAGVDVAGRVYRSGELPGSAGGGCADPGVRRTSGCGGVRGALRGVQRGADRG